MIIKKSAANVCCAPREYGNPFFWGDAVPSGIGCPLGCGDGMGQGGSVQEHVEMLGGMKRSGLPREERLLGASSRKIRHRGHAPQPGCAKTSLLPGRGREGQGCPGATQHSPKAPQPPKGSPRPPGKHPPRCGRCRRGDSAPACGCGERSSAPTGRAPGTGAALAPRPLYLLMVCLMGLSCRWM